MPANATVPKIVGRDALRGVTVLVVDDEPVLASTFCLVLQFAGAVSQSAANGRIALAMTGHQHFDIILCDRNMPIMGGIDFLHELRKSGNTTPVLILTGNVNADLPEELADIQIAGLVSKPILPAELIGIIQSTLGDRLEADGLTDF